MLLGNRLFQIVMQITDVFVLDVLKIEISLSLKVTYLS